MDKFCRYLLAVVCCLHFTQQLLPQNSRTEEVKTLKNGISKPVTLATHPFGVLFYTLPHNFKIRPDLRPTLDINLSSGNIWGQPVTTYLPENSAVREQISEIEFYDRIFEFDPDGSPSDSYTFAYDGILKDFRINAGIPLGSKYELSLTARSFLLSDGTSLFSVFTADRFIEFIHSSGIGGEDPFGRKVQGLDEAGIAYTDRNGNSLEINNGEFVFSGIETALYYYPDFLPSKQLYANMGLHLGTNLSPYNRSLDLGISVATVKAFSLKQRHQFLTGFGLNLLRRSVLSFSEDQTDLGTSRLFGSFEGHLEFNRQTRRGGTHSIGLNYRIQTPYNKKKEEAYYVPYSVERVKRWHEASRHLYKFPSYWSLIYSFTKKIEFSIYLQEDMVVNNAPDLQTGLRLRLPLSRF
ncbi:hypothetical protein [Poritiphilus flavus]|uniref:Uncharacterized protein n=1 Tax=Poritiphilus flavus TaxID=2697053 RepID=A0A6L9EGX2_9FLAO|nr:hypothetical protein [Poritiphilus flavus]NAS14040.1 hypothetical protein [Poritiphilus flavus]